MTTLFQLKRALLFVAIASFISAGVAQAADAKPIKVLLLAGGCCHDYGKQKDILKQGLEKRGNIKVDIIYTEDKSTKPPFPIYGNPDYAKGYDVVIHDECAADINDPKVIAGVLAPHRAGIPGVNLHCAMHCYRIGNPGEAATAGAERSMWFDYLGIQSSRHGPQEPIAITHTDKKHPITKGLEDWTTIKEELYNNIQIFPSATPLASGKQLARGVEVTSVVTWANDYKGTRVFSTTIGHNNDTVSDAKYLDLITRGLLWATKHLNDDGTPAKGYGPGGK